MSKYNMLSSSNHKSGHNLEERYPAKQLANGHPGSDAAGAVSSKKRGSLLTQFSRYTQLLSVRLIQRALLQVLDQSPKTQGLLHNSGRGALSHLLQDPPPPSLK